jgi:hypothetical protein
MVDNEDPIEMITVTINPGPVSAKKLSGAAGPIKLSVLYSSRVNLGQPALQTELRMEVYEIIRGDNPFYCHGQMELAGITHSFRYNVINDEIMMEIHEGVHDVDATLLRSSPVDGGISSHG